MQFVSFDVCSKVRSRIRLINWINARYHACHGFVFDVQVGALTPEQILIKLGAFSRIGGNKKNSNFVFIFFRIFGNLGSAGS